MILGHMEELFGQLLAVERELENAILALLRETDVEAHLPLREWQYLQKALAAYLSVKEKIIALIRPVKTEPEQNFWKGFAFALDIAGRSDLLSQYPGAQDAAALIEAECLLMDSAPPPVN